MTGFKKTWEVLKNNIDKDLVEELEVLVDDSTGKEPLYAFLSQPSVSVLLIQLIRELKKINNSKL